MLEVEEALHLNVEADSHLVALSLVSRKLLLVVVTADVSQPSTPPNLTLWAAVTRRMTLEQRSPSCL